LIFYYGLIVAGFVITLAVTLLYGCLAPWYKSETGRSFFTLLSALTLLLLNSVQRLVFGKTDLTLWIGLVLFVLYCIAMIFVGWHVYQAQVVRYVKNKKKKDA
jgi:hypothetical protein